MFDKEKSGVDEFYSSSSIASLLNKKESEIEAFCCQHQIKTKVHHIEDIPKLFVSSSSLRNYLLRLKESDRANIALKWQAFKKSIDGKKTKEVFSSEIPEGFVDTKEAARILGYTRTHIVKLCLAKKIFFKKIKSVINQLGYKYAISIASIEEYKQSYLYSITEGFVDAKEAARILGCSRNVITELCKNGEFKAQKIKYRTKTRSMPKWIISQEEIEKFRLKKEKKANMKNVKVPKTSRNNKRISKGYKITFEKKEQNNDKLKLPHIDLYQLQTVVDLNTLALVYPELRDFFVESREATIREFIINTIKWLSQLVKENPNFKIKN